MKEVAATYESWERLSTPYLKDERAYIKVRNPKTGAAKEVRWYAGLPAAKVTPQLFYFKDENDKILVSTVEQPTAAWRYIIAYPNDLWYAPQGTPHNGEVKLASWTAFKSAVVKQMQVEGRSTERWI